MVKSVLPMRMDLPTIDGSLSKSARHTACVRMTTLAVVPADASSGRNPRPSGSGTPTTLKKLSLMKEAIRTRGGSPGRSVMPTVS